MGYFIFIQQDYSYQTKLYLNDASKTKYMWCAQIFSTLQLYANKFYRGSIRDCKGICEKYQTKCIYTDASKKKRNIQVYRFSLPTMMRVIFLVEVCRGMKRAYTSVHVGSCCWNWILSVSKYLFLTTRAGCMVEEYVKGGGTWGVREGFSTLSLSSV